MASRGCSSQVEARQQGLIGSTDEVNTVTKVWFDSMGYDATLASAMRSMEQLQTERLDG